MPVAVGSVPFLNARPLVWALESQPEVTVVYDWPSRLPARLDSGELAAVLVSSIEAFATVGRRFAEGCAVATFGRVRSVRLFSKVPLAEVQTLALDASSMTSNALARILLRDMFGTDPELAPKDPDGDRMLESCDAAVLIGDNGLTYPADGLHTLDLGQAWRDLTGLPFVWALWVGGESLTPDLAGRLQEAADAGRHSIPQVIAATELPPGVDERLAHAYLGETFDYAWGPAQAEGLAEFGRRLHLHGLLETLHTPTSVKGAVPTPF